jgi:hypothetical protein
MKIYVSPKETKCGKCIYLREQAGLFNCKKHGWVEEKVLNVFGEKCKDFKEKEG